MTPLEARIAAAFAHDAHREAVAARIAAVLAGQDPWRVA